MTSSSLKPLIYNLCLCTITNIEISSVLKHSNSRGGDKGKNFTLLLTQKQGGKDYREHRQPSSHPQIRALAIIAPMAHRTVVVPESPSRHANDLVTPCDRFHFIYFMPTQCSVLTTPEPYLSNSSLCKTRCFRPLQARN